MSQVTLKGLGQVARQLGILAAGGTMAEGTLRRRSELRQESVVTEG